MGKDNVLEYPKLDNEVITVKNFMVIKEATMKCGDITVLVGEQGMGKSLLAKLRYFFWDYQEGLMHLILLNSDNPSKFKDIKGYSELKIKYFHHLFPNIKNIAGEFFAQFQSGDIFISIKRKKKGAEIEIDYSSGLADIIKTAQITVDDVNALFSKKPDSKNKLESVNSRSFEKTLMLYNRILPDKFPHVLYIPASRLFLATLQGNIFRFMASGEYSLDPLLKQFAGFWEGCKESFSEDFNAPDRDKHWFDDARSILAGDYIHRNDKDYIETTWGGTVELKDASSGQQEVLPLLAAISDMPNLIEETKLLIIEEPEAHLFPSFQRTLIKMIADVAREEGCKVMITTHSPYVPTCLNNEIIISQNKGDPLDVKAYYVSKGTVQDIYDKEDDLIDTNDLDSASQEIMTEYYHALKEHDERTESKDKSGE